MKSFPREPFQVLLFLVSVSLCCGMAVDLREIFRHKKQMYPMKRGIVNPCPGEKPFLCKASLNCISLSYVCDSNPDCEDGFDESPSVCNAAHRPPVEQMYQYLEYERDWILPKLFDGIDPDTIAHLLATSRGLNDMRDALQLTDESVDNIRTAFQAAHDDDEGPLMDLGMPEGDWHQTQQLFNTLLETHFIV